MRLICAIFFLFINTLLYATTLVVDSTGNGAYTEIQPALDDALDGDTIFVKVGTYKAFWVRDKEITIIGESQMDTKISDNRISTISTIHKCEINNLRFTGSVMHGGLYIENYTWYRETRMIPELIIENCFFDYSPPADIEGTAIIIVVNYEDMMQGDELDTLSSKIRIYNNTFDNVKTAIEIYEGGILAKLQNTYLDSLKILNFDCRDNYYSLFDSISIGQHIYDDSDTVGFNFVNVTHFNFSPWADTLITNTFIDTTFGIRYNNFINNEEIFIGGLQWDTTYQAIDNNYILPESFDIFQVYPNPFNSEVKVEFQIYKRGEITFRCFDSTGREIKKFYSKKILGAGLHSFHMNFSDLASGLYTITLTNERRTKAIKALLIK